MPPSAASAVSPLSVVAEEELRTFVLETLADLARESPAPAAPAPRPVLDLGYYPTVPRGRAHPRQRTVPGLAAHRHGRVWAP